MVKETNLQALYIRVYVVSMTKIVKVIFELMLHLPDLAPYCFFLLPNKK